MVTAPHLDALSISNLASILNSQLNGNRIGAAGRPKPLSTFAPNPAIYQPNRLLPGLASRLGYPAMTPLAHSGGRVAESKDGGRRDRSETQQDTDKVELSSLARDAIKEAVDSALHQPVNGATQQVFVSEDGRYQVTIDLKLNRDGSFDLDLSVGMAAGRAAGVQGLLQEEPGIGANELPGGVGMAGAVAIQETTLEYERLLATREWEARIFYSSTERVAAAVEQAHGPELGGGVLSVGADLSREFQLNISITGEDLNSFLAQVQELSVSEEASDLAGFLDAVANVLTSAPESLGDLFRATEALIARATEHVADAVDHFFAGIWDTFGSQLQEIGFEYGLIEDMSATAQRGLRDFLDVTNRFFASILGIQQERVVEDPIADSGVRVLQESLGIREEAFQERLEQAEEKQM